MKGARLGFVLVAVFLIFSLIGCDAFVRKFTRKPKKSEEPQELVLAPEEYKGPGLSREELYRQSLLFWKSWMDELIETLNSTGSYKRQVKSTDEAIKNATDMRKMLNDDGKKKFDVYLKRLTELRESISGDMYNSRTSLNRSSTERIRRDMLRDFSYAKAKTMLL
ncbi:MAG: hypothetical protein NTY47_00390 [Candidatus Omnitrophica bacterium]|nr:hypothetical protein [Candidatus Omnitrophota bacterium]